VESEIPQFKQIEALSPSAKLVLKVLQYNGALTQQQIARESYLPTRTVRYALNVLHKLRIIEMRFNFKDARQKVYSIVQDLPQSEAL
jgi:DNA-binding MarR family transcriptional regulator